MLGNASAQGETQECIADHECKQIVAKLCESGITTSMDDMFSCVERFDKKLEFGVKYQWELSEFLNRNWCKAEGFDAYGYPQEFFKLDMERLGIVGKRKKAKVIQFEKYRKGVFSDNEN